MDGGKRTLLSVAHLHKVRGRFGFGSLERCVSPGGPESCAILDVAALTDTDAKKKIERLCGARTRNLFAVLIFNEFV